MVIFWNIGCVIINIIINIDNNELNRYKNEGFVAYIGIATKGVNIWPIGYTDPRYPAAEPWFSGAWDNDKEDDIAGLIIPPPRPFINNDK